MFPSTRNNLTTLNICPACAISTSKVQPCKHFFAVHRKRLVYLKIESPALHKQAELDVLRSHRRGFFRFFESFTNTSWNFILQRLTGDTDEIHLKLHLALPGRQPGAGAEGEP